MKIKISLLTIPATLLFCQLTIAKTTQQGKESVSSSVTAKVIDINYKTREVTLQTPDGEKQTIEAGDRIKNLNEVKVGDTVHADYTEAIAIEINKGGKVSGAKETLSSTHAKPGTTPAGVAERKITASVIISAIDKKGLSVTFKDVDGDTTTLKVMHPEKLKGVNVGDIVSIIYSEALALRVEKKKL